MLAPSHANRPKGVTMSTIAKTVRAALVVAILALTTAGAAFADANRPSDANSPATHPDPGQILYATGPSTHHPDPGRIIERSFELEPHRPRPSERCRLLPALLPLGRRWTKVRGAAQARRPFARL